MRDSIRYWNTRATTRLTTPTPANQPPPLKPRLVMKSNLYGQLSYGPPWPKSTKSVQWQCPRRCKGRRIYGLCWAKLSWRPKWRPPRPQHSLPNSLNLKQDLKVVKVTSVIVWHKQCVFFYKVRKIEARTWNLMVIMKQKESLVKIQKPFCVVEFIWSALLRGRLFARTVIGNN